MSHPHRCPACGGEIGDADDTEFMGFDREYFEQHPRVRSFLRKPFPGEHPFECIGVAAVRVTEVRPGVRLRSGAELCHEFDPRAEVIFRPDRQTPGVYVELEPS